MAGSDFHKNSKPFKITGDQILTDTNSAASDPETRDALLALTNAVSTMQDEMRAGFSAVSKDKVDNAAILDRVKHDRKTWMVVWKSVFKKKDEEIKNLKAQLQERADCKLQKENDVLRENLKAKEDHIKAMIEADWQHYCLSMSYDAEVGDLRARTKAREDAAETNNLARCQNILNGTLQDQHIFPMRDAQNAPLRACPTDLEGFQMLTDSDINLLLGSLGLSIHGSVEQRHYRLADYMGVADRIFCLGRYVGEEMDLLFS